MLNRKSPIPHLGFNVVCANSLYYSVLAHEIGHAYHSFVLRDQPLFLQDYPMNLAETASTFAEAVLGEERLEATEERSGKLAILDTMLSDSVGFLMNIHARFLFEDRFHVERSTGELSAERFSELMVEAQEQAYLGALGDDGWNDTFWISKLHFYITGVTFYNFPYTFGFLLSRGLFAEFKERGSGFLPHYEEFLRLSGSATSEQLARRILGCDLESPEFWKSAIETLRQPVETGPRFAEYLASVPREEQRTVEMLVGLNARVAADVDYLIRMEPGVQTPEETLVKGSGSCRDSSWLLVNLARHLGFAARFVSGATEFMSSHRAPLAICGAPWCTAASAFPAVTNERMT